MTLGIMGLDKVGLQIVATAGDTEKERRHARELKNNVEGGERKGVRVRNGSGVGQGWRARAGRPSSTRALAAGRNVLVCTPLWAGEVVPTGAPFARPPRMPACPVHTLTLAWATCPPSHTHHLHLTHPPHPFRLSPAHPRKGKLDNVHPADRQHGGQRLPAHPGRLLRGRADRVHYVHHPDPLAGRDRAAGEKRETERESAHLCVRACACACVRLCVHCGGKRGRDEGRDGGRSQPIHPSTHPNYLIFVSLFSLSPSPRPSAPATASSWPPT